MPELARSARPILSALFCTALSLIAFAALLAAGFGADSSLVAGLVVAGLLNIARLASLNCEVRQPTCQAEVGELSR